MLKIRILIFFSLISLLSNSQVQTEKVINQQTQTWVSLNSVTKLSNHWGVVVDAHIRTNDFFDNNNFYFLRGGVRYFVNPSINLTTGYAHLWLAPTKEDWTIYSDENRIYQQVQLSSKIGNVSMLQRIRNEQRWQEKIVNNLETGENRFSNRVRYLLSFDIPVFNKKSAPSIVISDELLFQFGKEMIYNTFDQNRLFIGVKQSINPKLSYDFGYMNVYQQKISGYQYDMNHTLRLFFYLNTSVNVKKSIAATHN